MGTIAIVADSGVVSEIDSSDVLAVCQSGEYADRILNEDTRRGRMAATVPFSWSWLGPGTIYTSFKAIDF